MTGFRQLTRPRRFATAAAGIFALVATASLSAVPNGSAGAAGAPGAACPAAYPESGLGVGDPVTGLTVTRGTVPESFDGEVLGVAEDFLAPGRDLIMVDLHSPTIDRVGVWEGMSGSPVYASDGRLIGAVAWGMTDAASTVVGLTPAADMRALLDGTSARARRPGASRTRAALPPALAARIVRTGAATRAEVAGGLRQLRVPLGVSGVGAARLRQLAARLPVRHASVDVVPAGRTSAERIDVTPGGNLAASMSYGAISLTGLGTATMVCGSQVVGFGHPMNYSGPSTMGLHGARALYIQDYPLGSGFKVANVGAPIGSLDQDRLAGVHGVKGPLPASAGVTSLATKRAVRATASTRVTVPEVMPDAAAFNMLVVQDRAVDQTGAGTAWAGWTITGERKNGRRFEFRRRDLYADSEDIVFGTALALYDDVSAIADNEAEVVKITSVRTESHLGAPYETYSIRKVQSRVLGRWVGTPGNRPLPVRAGTVARLKVFLTSREGDPRTVVVRVFVPSHAAGQVGRLHLLGGYDGGSDEFFDEGEEEESTATFPQVLRALGAGPQNNQVVATLRFRHAPGAAGKPRTRTRTINRVVGGDLTVPAVALP